MSEVIRFESRRAGPIEVPVESVMTFEPFPGFAGCRRFVMMEHAEKSELAWLVSLEDADLAFVVANPWTFFPDYDPPIAREHLATLGIEKKEEVEILCFVTLAGKSIHLNLAAPLLINVATRRGLQVISDDTTFSMRMPIPALQTTAKETEAVEAAKQVSGQVASGSSEAAAKAAGTTENEAARASGKVVPPTP